MVRENLTENKNKNAKALENCLSAQSLRLSGCIALSAMRGTQTGLPPKSVYEYREIRVLMQDIFAFSPGSELVVDLAIPVCVPVPLRIAASNRKDKALSINETQPCKSLQIEEIFRQPACSPLSYNA